jgi:hypothetical protein
MLNAYIYDGLRSPIGRHAGSWQLYVQMIWQQQSLRTC